MAKISRFWHFFWQIGPIHFFFSTLPLFSQLIYMSTVLRLLRLLSRADPHLKRQSHRHDARPAHWKSSNFGQCVVVRWVCVVRASSALDQRYAFVVVRCVRRDFCACTKMCAELDAWMYTPEGRQRCAERAGPTPDTRGAHAEHTLGMRCVFVDWVLTHTKPIMSAHPACF